MRTLAIVVARMGSTRLPGKAMLPILGKPMIERMIDRVRQARHVDGVVLATTDLPADDALASWAARAGVGCFRGSAEDVLGRVGAAATEAGADWIVELLGDNPLVHSDLIDDVIEFFGASNVDYAASVTKEYPFAGIDVPRFPVGIRVQVVTNSALARCERLATDPRYREHSTNYIYEHPDLFRLGYFPASGSWSALNWPDLTFAVNYRKNFELVRQIFDACYPKNRNFSLLDVMSVYEGREELVELMGAE